MLFFLTDYYESDVFDFLDNKKKSVENDKGIIKIAEYWYRFFEQLLFTLNWKCLLISIPMHGSAEN